MPEAVASPASLQIQLGNDAPLLPVVSSFVAQTVPDGAITTTKLADRSVAQAKLAASALVPVGAVIAWYGDPANMTDGWALCDGTVVDDPESELNGLPTSNLIDRFLRGVAVNVRPTPDSRLGDADTDGRSDAVAQPRH